MLRIRWKDLDDIVYHCVREQPIEACGILSGKSGKVDGSVVREVLKVYRCMNEFNSRTEYRIAGEEQLRVFDEIENSGSEVLGLSFSSLHVLSAFFHRQGEGKLHRIFPRDRFFASN
jgi:proteasome lid subunit RPN8/RPN11